MVGIMITIQNYEVTRLIAPITQAELALFPLQHSCGVQFWTCTNADGQYSLGELTDLTQRTDAEIMLTTEYAAWMNQQADTIDATINANELRALLAPQVAAIETAEVDNFASLFPAFRVGEAVTLDERRQYQGVVWKVAQPHTTQADWQPDLVPALWLRVNPPDVILPWVQPQGSFDAYQIGDKVTYNDQTWICTAANNVYAPGVYGWEVFGG
jgi:hypothetical protein